MRLQRYDFFPIWQRKKYQQGGKFQALPPCFQAVSPFVSPTYQHINLSTYQPFSTPSRSPQGLFPFSSRLPKVWFKYDSSMPKETLGHDESVTG